MANEIQVDLSLKLTRSGDTRATFIESFAADQSGSRNARFVQNVNSTSTLIGIPTIGTFGWAIVKNLSTTSGNHFSLMLDNDTTHKFLRVDPGEAVLTKLGTNVTAPYGIFATVASQVEILVLEL